MGTMMMTSLAFVVLIAGADAPGVPKLIIGKETTYVEGPLTPEGSIDYAAALAERLGKGVTPQTNAVVLLWRARGPKGESNPERHPSYFEALGMETPPVEGNYFVGSFWFWRNQSKYDYDKIRVLSETEDQCARSPWKSQDHPDLAAFLKANEAPLALVVEASKRPHYYTPPLLKKLNGERNNYISAILPDLQIPRQYASALLLRAMQHLGENRPREAWEDILAVKRLGRLISQGATLIEYLFGIAIEGLSRNAILTYLEVVPMTADELQSKWREIEALPKMELLWPKVELAERFNTLDGIQQLRHDASDAIFHKTEGLSKLQAKAMQRIDLSPYMRDANRTVDETVTAMKKDDRSERRKALAEIETRLQKQTETQEKHLKTGINAQLDLGGRAQARLAVEKHIYMVVRGGARMATAEDRREIGASLLQTAFALQRHRVDTGRYPSKLDDLTPKYLAAVPVDLFANQPMRYSSDGKSYKLWSVGPDGKDIDGTQIGNGINIAMPRPPVKP